MAPKWGAGNYCPACNKQVYPNEQIFDQDRKPWHRPCIKCGTRGCRWKKKELRISLQSLLIYSNQLRAGGFHKHDSINVCDRCHNELYGPAKVG